MNLDFDRLCKIYKKGGDALLYQEREALLQEYVDSLPEDRKHMAIEFCKKVSNDLTGLSPMQRVLKLTAMMQYAVFDLTDAWLDLTNEVKGTADSDQLINRHRHADSDRK